MKRILINILLILFIINDFESSQNLPIYNGEKLENTITTKQNFNTPSTWVKVESKVAGSETLSPEPNEDMRISIDIPPLLNTTTEKIDLESKEPQTLPPDLSEKIQISRDSPPYPTPFNEEVKSESKLGDHVILPSPVTGEIELIRTAPSFTIDTKEVEYFRKMSPEYKQSYSDHDDFVQETPIRYTLKRSLSANASPTNQYYQEKNRLQKQTKPSFSAYIFPNRLFSDNALRSSTNITDATAILRNGKSSMPPANSKLSIQQTIVKASIRSIPDRTSIKPMDNKASTQRPLITLKEISDAIALRYLNIKNHNPDARDLLTLDIEQALLDEGNPEQTITPQLIRILNEKIFHILEESKQALERRQQIKPIYNQSHTPTHGNMSTAHQSYTQGPDSSSSKLSPQEPYEAWTDEQQYSTTSTIARQQKEEEEAVYSDAIHTWLQLSLSERLTYNVLSIDGGGVRGIVACKLIEEIEEQKLKAFETAQTQHTVRLQDFFNVYTGTSIGGIIAIGLLLQDSQGNFLYHPSELKNILINNASVIFHKNFFRRLTQLFRPRYSNKNLKLLIETIILGNHTEDELKKAGIKYNFPKYNANNNQLNSILDKRNVIKNLSDIKCSTKNIRLIIPSYDIQNKKILIFDSEMINKNAMTGGDETAGKDFSLVDICMATSAAPLYFSTYPVTPLNDNTARYNCVDGGLFLNFPASATISKLIDHCMVKPQIYTVSITTGSAGDVTENNKEKHRGLINWLQNGLIHIMRSSPTQLAENIVNNCVKNHIRFCVRLETSSKEMDDSRWSNLSHLINDTKNYIARHMNNLFLRIVNELPLISNHINLNPGNSGNASYPILGNDKIAPALSQYSAIGASFVSNNITPIAYNPEYRIYNGAYVILPPISPALNYHSQETEDTSDNEDNRVTLDMRDI